VNGGGLALAESKDGKKKKKIVAEKNLSVRGQKNSKKKQREPAQIAM